jgi:hypothetical protein
VLGVLIEKSLTQPEHYPMSLNAVVAACNQKSNRDPVMDLDEDVVSGTLRDLREKQLVTHVLPATGSRVERFKHDLRTAVGWEKREQAILAELLLRGPQTPGELRGRCSRMMPFNDFEAVMIVLELLAGHEPPLVRSLPREPGRSAIRYAHALYPDHEIPAVGPSAGSHAIPSAASATAKVQPRTAELVAVQGELEELRAMVEALSRRVERLEVDHPARSSTPGVG